MTSNNAYTRRTMLFNIEDGLILLAIFLHPIWCRNTFLHTFLHSVGKVKKKEQAVQIQINVLCGFPSKRFFRLLFRPLLASYVFFKPSD